MPEITEAQLREYQRYQQFGTPDEVDGRLKKHDKLVTENGGYRDEIRDLKAKVPAEGAVILTGDDAVAWPKYQALGKVEELEALPGKVKELEQTVAERTRRDAITAAVRAAGWPDETVATLLDLRSLDGAAFELKKEKVKGKDNKETEVDVPYVTLTGEGQKAQKLADFAASTPTLKGLKTETAAEGAPGKQWRPQPVGDPAPEAPTVDQIAERKRASGAYRM
jgi:hypothetical protein